MIDELKVSDLGKLVHAKIWMRSEIGRIKKYDNTTKIARIVFNNHNDPDWNSYPTVPIDYKDFEVFGDN